MQKPPKEGEPIDSVCTSSVPDSNPACPPPWAYLAAMSSALAAISSCCAASSCRLSSSSLAAATVAANALPGCHPSCLGLLLPLPPLLPGKSLALATIAADAAGVSARHSVSWSAAQSSFKADSSISACSALCSAAARSCCPRASSANHNAAAAAADARCSPVHSATALGNA
jgi:hypothetical protein